MVILKTSFTHSPKDDWHYVLERLQGGQMAATELITHRFPLEELYLGFEIMRDKKENTGR